MRIRGPIGHNTVVLDRVDDLYAKVEVGSLLDMRLTMGGFEVLRLPLSQERAGIQRYDPDLVSEALLSLA